MRIRAWHQPHRTQTCSGLLSDHSLLCHVVSPDRFIEKAAMGAVESGGSTSRREKLIELGGDDLAEKLDSIHGGEVTDHSVFTWGPAYCICCVSSLSASSFASMFL